MCESQIPQLKRAPESGNLSATGENAWSQPIVAFGADREEYPRQFSLPEANRIGIRILGKRVDREAGEFREVRFGLLNRVRFPHSVIASGDYGVIELRGLRRCGIHALTIHQPRET